MGFFSGIIVSVISALIITFFGLSYWALGAIAAVFLVGLFVVLEGGHHAFKTGVNTDLTAFILAIGISTAFGVPYLQEMDILKSPPTEEEKKGKPPLIGELFNRFLGDYEAVIDKGSEFEKYHSSCANPIYSFVREKVESGEIPDHWIMFTFQSESKYRINSSKVIDGKYPALKMEISRWENTSNQTAKEITFTDYNGLRVLSLNLAGKNVSYMHEIDLRDNKNLKTSPEKCQEEGE